MNLSTIDGEARRFYGKLLTIDGEYRRLSRRPMVLVPVTIFDEPKSVGIPDIVTDAPFVPAKEKPTELGAML